MAATYPENVVMKSGFSDTSLPIDQIPNPFAPALVHLVPLSAGHLEKGNIFFKFLGIP